MRPLPAGAVIIAHPHTGVRFVEFDGKLIPNQGTTPYETEKDLVRNFWDCAAKGLLGEQHVTDWATQDSREADAADTLRWAERRLRGAIKRYDRAQRPWDVSISRRYLRRLVAVRHDNIVPTIKLERLQPFLLGIQSLIDGAAKC